MAMIMMMEARITQMDVVLGKSSRTFSFMPYYHYPIQMLDFRRGRVTRQNKTIISTHQEYFISAPTLGKG